MDSSKHLDQSLSDLRAEIRALDIGDEEARRRLDGLVAAIEASTRDQAGARRRRHG